MKAMHAQGNRGAGIEHVMQPMCSATLSAEIPPAFGKRAANALEHRILRSVPRMSPPSSASR